MKGYSVASVIGFLSIVITFGCASHNISSHDSNKIRVIKSWHLSLTEDMAAFEKALDSEEYDNIKSKRTVFLKCDVKLRDGIALYLARKHKINLVKEPSSMVGYIRTDAVCQWGYYVTLDAEIYDWEDNLLAEVEVKNGEDMLVKNDEEFAEYCADAIAKLLGKQ